MTVETAQKPTFFGTVKLLLKAARMRAHGRRKRQRQLLSNRTAGKGFDWSGIGYAAFIFFALALNGFAVASLNEAIGSAQRVEVERQGKIVVSREFFSFATHAADWNRYTGDSDQDPSRSDEYGDEARRISESEGGSRAAIEQRLRDAVQSTGTMDLVPSRVASPGLKALARTGPLPQIFGSLFLFWWLMMLAFQGEGLEMDVQRRRHPVWELIFSHPVPPGAVFLAEMLSPIAANPMYWGAPLFVGFVFALAYDPGVGLIASALVGVPVTIAGACLGKALEMGITLRLAPRSRGAVIGLMSWLGYTAMMSFLVGMYFIPRFITATSGFFRVLAVIPWPWLSLFLGGRADGSWSFSSGVLVCWFASLLIIVGAVWFSVWATEIGLAGGFASDSPGPSAGNKAARFGKEPLYRKEMMWFLRDRSALVQCILVPLSVAGFQVFNLRRILVSAESEWNYLCGVAIFFGTYFLWVLGPKSLQSEGSALWIALTWPRGLESLLKAKAWLWTLLSSALVAVVLGYAAFTFRSDIWKIALVGVGWYIFARSMAEKSVTLVTITSESGETEKIPKGRRFAAQLGMLTFAIGIVTQQWQLAIIGIVFSYLTSAAMWQNFRARLPYLYDPWSEKVPPAPTLMHAMIAVSILVEVAAIISAPLIYMVGRDHLGAAQAVGYGASAIAVSLFVAKFLRDRDVRAQDIWTWLPDGKPVEEGASWARRFGLAGPTAIRGLLMGACGGLALGLFAHGYLAVLRWMPATAELIRKSQEQMASMPDLRLWYGIMAVGFAPFAEEYLFRGLLFRALDREWGGWRAVAGSAAFFAIYHPPLAWVPVALLGVSNCLLFKRTGRLAPAVLLHMVYNAVVLIS